MYPHINSGEWHLLPTNIVILNSLIKNHQGKGIIDIGCGLGNFFGYLLHYFPNEKVIGVDNFSQIDVETVKTYQNSLCKVDITTIWPSEFYETAILVGVPLSDIYRKINKLNIKYLYVETEYLLQYKNFKKLKNYKLIATNDIFSKYMKVL
jgi:hypothetical protein